MQLRINFPWDLVCGWIPYNKLSNIKKVKNDAKYAGYTERNATVNLFTAIWNGPLIYDYENKKEYTRVPGQEVVLISVHRTLSKYIVEVWSFISLV